jgi:hypothetical protein
VYCTSCGNELPPGARECGSCAQPVPHFPAPPKIPNYLVFSIVASVCCCPPFGLVALFFSAQVNTKLAIGDIAGAQMSSRRAKTWVIVAVVAAAVTGAGVAALSLWQ